MAYTKAGTSFFDLTDEINQLTLKSSIGAVVGAGVTRRIAPDTALRIDLEDRIYKSSVDTHGSTQTFKDRTQHDLVFDAGLSIHL